LCVLIVRSSIVSSVLLLQTKSVSFSPAKHIFLFVISEKFLRLFKKKN
jgi:hypothetical protein